MHTTINKQFSSSKDMFDVVKRDGSNMYSSNTNNNNNNNINSNKKNTSCNGQVKTNAKFGTTYNNSKIHDDSTNEKEYKNGKNRVLKQMSDIYNYNTKHNTHMLKKKHFNNNENIMSVRSLNLDNVKSENMGSYIKQEETKSSQTDTSNAFDELFSKNEFKIEKIKETYYQNRNSASSNSNNKVKKNPTSILPFDRIIEKHSLNTIMSKQNIQELYSHKNMYGEHIGENYSDNIPNNNITTSINNNHISNNTNRRLDIVCDNYRDDTSTIRRNGINNNNNNNNSDKDIFDVDQGMQICSKGQNSRMPPDENNLTNLEINNRWNNWNENFNDTNRSSRNKKNNGNDGEWENGFMLNQQRAGKESYYKTEEGYLSKTDADDDIQQQSHNLQNGKKMTYYPVVNHYNPYTNKENDVSIKKSGIYNYGIYENDIYDYLLNQYEKNYKKLIMQKQPIRKALTEYWGENDDNYKYNIRGINEEYAGQQKEKKRTIQVEEIKDSDPSISHNRRESTSDSNKSSLYSRGSNKSENEKEKDKKKERMEETGMKSCKLISKNNISKYNKNSFSTFCSSELQPSLQYNCDSFENRDTTEQGNIKGCHIICNDDTFDIYKDIECIHTHTPQLFAYTIQSKTSNGERTLKINKDCKKIFKKMKNKNTVVISNIGRKCGSSTFSNFLINNPQINNFTSDSQHKKKEECVYAYITTNKNKINYVYLDYDKMHIDRNNVNRRKNGKSEKSEKSEKGEKYGKSKSRQTDSKCEKKPNIFMSLSFYFSNIVIVHIDNNNYLDMFTLIADYYTIIKNIKESIRQKRKKYKTEKEKKEKENNMKDNFLKLNKNSLGRNSSEEKVRSDSSYLESDDSNKNILDENNFYFPYFIFIFTINKNHQTYNNQEEQKGKEIMTIEKGNTNENNSLGNYKNVQEYLDYLVSQIKDKKLKAKVEYVFNFFTKKNLVYLPPLYNNTEDNNLINYEYIDSLKKIKKELFIHSKSIDNMYNNNGLYIYKYLNMVIYTTNNNIYYSSNDLKRKIEIFENKMLHDILTENFLINIRTKMEKNLPLKADFLLTSMNEQKVDFLLTYEKFAAGNESTKIKYKNELITNIDNIILKAYKENLAYSYFSFYNEINKKIKNLKITDKINDGTYETFDQLLIDLDNVNNDENKENLVYNEIFNKVKEDLIANFVKKNYQDKHTQTNGNMYSEKTNIHNYNYNNNNNNGTKQKIDYQENNKYNIPYNYEITNDNDSVTEESKKNKHQKRNKAFYQTNKSLTTSTNTKDTSERNGITIYNNNDDDDDNDDRNANREKEKEKERKGEDINQAFQAPRGQKKKSKEEKDNQKKNRNQELYDGLYEEEEVEDQEQEQEQEQKQEQDWENEQEEMESEEEGGEEGEEEEEEEETEEVHYGSGLKKNKKYYRDSEYTVPGEKYSEGSALGYGKNVYPNNNGMIISKRKSEIGKLKKMKNLNSMKSKNSSFNDIKENYTKEKNILKKKIIKKPSISPLKNTLYTALQKNKSDRYVTDNRRKQIKNINNYIKKYHSADYQNEKSNIHIYKHLMNYEDSNTSEKSADELLYVPTEFNKDINRRKNKKKDFSFDSTLTDDHGYNDDSNINRGEQSNYTKDKLKHNSEKYSTEIAKSKMSCFPKPNAKRHLKLKLRKKNKCLIM